MIGNDDQDNQDHAEDEGGEQSDPIHFTDEEFRQLFQMSEDDAESDDRTGPDYEATIRALTLYADDPTDANYEAARRLLDSLDRQYAVDLSDEAAVAHVVNQLPSAIITEREEIIATLKKLVARKSPTVALGGVKPKRLRWMMKGWLPVGEIGLLAGEWQLGKSTLAIQLANAISGGTPALAKPASPCAKSLLPRIQPEHRGRNTLIIGWEHDADEAARRLRMIRNAFGDDPSDGAPQRIHYKDANGLGPTWGRAGGRFGQLAQTPLCREIRAEAEDMQAALLVLDPVARAFGGEQNSRSEIGGFLDDWSIWAKRTGVAVMFIGHVPKSSSRYDDLSAWNTYVQYLWTLKSGGASDIAKPSGAKPGSANKEAAIRPGATLTLEKSGNMPQCRREREIWLEFEARRSASDNYVGYGLRERVLG